jgi:large subunit ribosomal protein L10
MTLRATRTIERPSNGFTASLLRSSCAPVSPFPGRRRSYATAPPIAALRLPDDYVPPTKPPSTKPSDIRKSQLLRTYTALLRSSPLVLLFQHNNLTGAEFSALRRELYAALRQVSSGVSESDAPVKHRLEAVAEHTKLQVVRKGIFDLALRVVEFFDPASVPAVEKVEGVKPPKESYAHDLSVAATEAARKAKDAEAGTEAANSAYAQLSPLLVGPLAILSFPSVSPVHLAAALKILAPSPPAFPAPSRKKAPGYYDPIAQAALQKVLLIGGRVEGRVFDVDGVQWIGGIEGGLEGLRAQLVGMLQSAGLGLTSVLEGAGKSLWITVEGRRLGLEEEKNGTKVPAGEAEQETKA